MNKIKLGCLVSLLVSGVAQASAPCNGFEIKVKNNLPHDLVTTQIQLNGADIQPAGIQKLDSNSETVFIINGSTDDTAMTGNLVFHTVSLPTKVVRINFDLHNAYLICRHNDTSPASDYPVQKSRIPGKVTYTIGN